MEQISFLLTKVSLLHQAHFFWKILSRQENQQNPLLYLKGIHLKELQALLDFIYYGEVYVEEESLNDFLKVAEDLAIKGMKNDIKKTNSTETKGICNRLP